MTDSRADPKTNVATFRQQFVVFVAISGKPRREYIARPQGPRAQMT